MKSKTKNYPFGSMMSALFFKKKIIISFKPIDYFTLAPYVLPLYLRHF